MLLLLLWRHAVFYSQGEHLNNPNLKTTTQGLMRHLPKTFDGEAFTAEAAKRIPGAIQRLSNLDLVRVILRTIPQEI